MHTIEVGKLYIPGKTSYREAGEYNYRAGTHQLVLFYRDPLDEEVRDIQNGEATFAFAYEQPDILVFLYKFAGMGWSDAPYSIHFVPEAERTLPPVLTGEQRVLLNIVLVDAATGIVRAIRMISLSTLMSRKLHEFIAQQAAAQFDVEAYDVALAKLQQRLTPADLAKRAMATSRVLGASN